VDNGLLSNTAKQIYAANESLSFTCNTGYIPRSVETTCQPTKVWSPPPVCNIVNCTVPTLNNGHYFTKTRVSANKLTYTYGTTLNIQCNEWYEIFNGSDSLTCQEDGTWSPSPPQCVKIICNDSTDVYHASIDNYPELGVGESGNVSYNSTYHYITEGSLEVTCTESRRFAWTTQPLFGKVSFFFALHLFSLTHSITHFISAYFRSFTITV